MPGGKGAFPTLTVAEHFDLAGWLHTGDKGFDGRVAEVLERFPRLQERWDTAAGSLSGGEQQQLALGMAFVARPKLLLIDELSLGLSPTVVTTLLDMVRAIHAEGTTVVVVEQSVNVALTLAERAYFLEKGQVRFSGPTTDLLGRDDVLRSVFLAGAAKDAVPVAAAGGARDRPGRTARRSSAAARRPLREGSLQCRTSTLAVLPGRGGRLVGANGAGKTTLLRPAEGIPRSPAAGTWRPGRRT
jgi:branched-chain amino acid transport system ATP-binding protein